QVLIGELLTIYESLRSGGGLPQAGAQDKYEDYIRYIEGRDKEREELHWRGYLSGLTSSSLLPFVGSMADRNKGVGVYRNEPLLLDKELTASVDRYAQVHRLTVNTVMQGVWSYLLSRYTRSSRVTYGVTVSGRPEELTDVESRIGLYINTVPLHARIEAGQETGAWLAGLQQGQLECREYQYTGLSTIQRWIGVQGDLFDSLLIFENYPVNTAISSRIWSLQMEGVQVKEHTNYPLSIIIGGSEEMSIHFSYNSRLLEESYVRWIKGHFEEVLRQMVSGRCATVGELRLLTLPEEKQLVERFNGTARAYPKDRSVVDLFEEQAEAIPGDTAIVFESAAGRRELTYGELNERANQLGHYLKRLGVQTEELVPICVERGVDMLVGMLGILKAGGAYVPIDPEYPQDRIGYMLDDTGARMVLGSAATRSRLPMRERCRLVNLDEDWPDIGREPATRLPGLVAPGQLAYVIYTSGSTGRPKGVMIEHRGVVNLVYSQAAPLSLRRGICVFQFASFGFDASCYEIFCTLLHGGRLVLADKQTLLDPSVFLPVLIRQKVELIVLPTSYQSQLKGDLIHLKTIVSAGEPLNAEIGKEIQRRGIKLINAYGPTENTVCAVLSEQPLRENGSITIGKPIDNVQIYIVDDDGRLQAVGVTGEICIGGAGLARGYLRREELTAAKFVPNPYSRQADARMYKTGDWGRWLPDGNIEYLGRMDEQVKVRGYRIELGEIESVLQQSGLVSQGVVLARGDSSGNKRLIG
ncbi:MAG TPA: amino acid adenylation domain-containing protein, partial [Puia sp.]|nr:amino acid adenylation domain-containing protein [Puia sp.]